MSHQSELTLEEEEQAFNNWRFNRRGNEPIPNSLWDLVKILLNSYSRFDLMRRLKLTTLQFRQQGLLPLLQTSDKEPSPFFTPIPMIHPTVAVLEKKTEASNQLTIQHGETHLCLSNPSDGQLQLIITALLGDC
jgi:hypothetical protein